jgi:hypothetical protein
MAALHSSRAIIRVMVKLKTVVSETEQVSESLIFSSTMTRLVARKYFNAFICRESFKS